MLFRAFSVTCAFNLKLNKHTQTCKRFILISHYTVLSTMATLAIFEPPSQYAIGDCRHCLHAHFVFQIKPACSCCSCCCYVSFHISVILLWLAICNCACAMLLVSGTCRSLVANIKTTRLSVINFHFVFLNTLTLPTAGSRGRLRKFS